MNGGVLTTGWHALLARIDALSRRERLMVLAAALALVGFVGDTVLLAPQRAQRLQLERDAARERSELAAMNVQLAELKRKLAADPDEVPRLRLQQLSAELSELNAGFQRLERSLVPPEQMARLLEQVMQRTSGVSVVRLQTLPPRSLPERESDGAEASAQTGGAPAPAGGSALV
jgi:MSHA biogenesis protein MshJ